MYVMVIGTVELVSYQLKNIVVSWYDMWLASKGHDAPSMVWIEFSKAF